MMRADGRRLRLGVRAFTPNDADDLRKTARTFPVTEHYDVEEALTALGTGEALVTVLSPEGVPTPPGLDPAYPARFPDGAGRA